VTGLPPSDAGGENETVICPLPAAALTFCGADGTDFVVTAIGFEVTGPEPLSAETVMLYAVPGARPVRVNGLPDPETVIGVPPPAGTAVTVYVMFALPPVEEDGVKVTVAPVSVVVTVGLVGAEGVVNGVAETVFEAAPVASAPIALTAKS